MNAIHSHAAAAAHSHIRGTGKRKKKADGYRDEYRFGHGDSHDCECVFSLK